MKKFLGDDFLLGSKAAEILYHEYASAMPIIDYHCHLSPADIANDRVFNNITEAWLEGDHYKWRAMRTNGVHESFITGGKLPQEKFRKWAETVPFTIRNPLFHWTHLELRRYFGVTEILNGQTADAIYETTSAMLRDPANGCRGLMHKMNVETVCTTDDPLDSLNFHQQVASAENVQMLPAFRPDKLFAIDTTGFKSYLLKLGELVGFEVADYDALLQAAQVRIDYFHENGARLSDHGLEQLYDVQPNAEQANKALKKYLSGQEVTLEEVHVFKMTVLTELCRMYHAKGWVQQFHLGAIRNNNTRMSRILGPDTGFDSIGDFSQVRAMSRFLDTLDSTDQLAKTILYNLNPADNEAIATMIGNFNDGSVAGKIQFGSAWWFLDQKDGMEKQLNALSNMGLLSRMVGMLTDSRSFLSFPRHEYFRRILCNLIGQDVTNGELPNDMNLLGGIVKDVCYHNARNYFAFHELKQAQTA